jgi:hypothetical protein
VPVVAIGVANVLTRLGDPRCSLVVVVAAAAALKRDVYGTVFADENSEARSECQWRRLIDVGEGLSVAYHRLGLCGVLYPVIGFGPVMDKVSLRTHFLIAGTA